MNINFLFLSLITWLVKGALFVPFTLLRLIGLLLPPCSSFGLLSFSTAVMDAAVNWIRFLWPALQYVPWTHFWNFVSAVLLYILFKWMWKHLPQMMHFVISFWWIIAIFYVVAGALNFFLNSTWTNSPVFTDVFGSTATGTASQGFSGGGFGGGGGASW